jgi:hypothetical protein
LEEGNLMIRLLLPTESPQDDSGGRGAGYSDTPLVRKLGIKPGWRMLVIDPPAIYWELLGPLPEGTSVIPMAGSEQVEFVHLFTQDGAGLEQYLQTLRKRIVPHGMIWVSWPKKSSGVRTDLDETHIRTLALRTQLVDVKVAAIDQTWSGLKLVIRVKDR